MGKNCGFFNKSIFLTKYWFSWYTLYIYYNCILYYVENIKPKINKWESKIFKYFCWKIMKNQYIKAIKASFKNFHGWNNKIIYLAILIPRSHFQNNFKSLFGFRENPENMRFFPSERVAQNSMYDRKYTKCVTPM